MLYTLEKQFPEGEENAKWGKMAILTYDVFLENLLLWESSDFSQAQHIAKFLIQWSIVTLVIHSVSASF